MPANGSQAGGATSGPVEAGLVDPVSITYQGTVVLFARKAGKQVFDLYYNVRPADDPSGLEEWTGWTKLPMIEPSQHSDLPVQETADPLPLLRLAGIDLISVSSVATRPTPADAPFRVVTDGRYISCFRPTTNGTLYVDRFILVQIPETGPDPQAAPTGRSTWALRRVWELRYRRSQERDVPAGPDDALDSRNMLGEPFLEPTTEIPGVGGVTATYGFTVVLTPTATPNTLRWNFFVPSGTGITVTSFPQDDTGRVNVSAQPWSFTIETSAETPSGSQALACSGGVGAAVFEEQEQFTGPDGRMSTLRRASRVMATVPVTNAALGLPSALAIFDFLVQPDGTLPAFPVRTGCVPVDGSFQNGTFTPNTTASSYPVPDSAVHVVGDSTVSGVLLGQPQPGAAPLVFDGADGLVRCYFAGATDADGERPFLVAQYGALVTRPIAQLPWTAGTQTGSLLLVAQRSGTSLNELSVTVSDCAGQPDLANLSVNYGAAAVMPVETWAGVPRELKEMVAILNGGASGNAADPAVQAGDRPFYDYSGSLRQARLPLGAIDSPTGHVTVMSHRSDVPLQTVGVVAGGPGAATLTMTFTSPQGGTVIQTWQSVPTQSEELVPILAGDASPSTYAYAPAASDSKVYGIESSGGTILLFATAAADPITVTVAAATDLMPAHCDISVKPGAANQITLTNVSRNQGDFISALRENQAVAALFAYISPDPVAAAVVNQTVSAALDLRGTSILFDVLPPAAPDVVAPASVAAAILQGHTLTPTPQDLVPNHLYALVAIPRDSPVLGQTALIQNVVAAAGTLGSNGSWVAAPTPQAISFGGTDALSVPTSTPAALELAPGRAWTLEAWCQPTDGASAALLSYNGGSPKQFAGVEPSYFLGTTGLPALSFQSYAPTTPYAGSYVGVPADARFDVPALSTFTWEAWVKPNDPPCPAGGTEMLGCIVQGQNTTLPATAQFQLGLNIQRQLVFGYRTGQVGQPTESYMTVDDALAANTWTHVAVTGSKEAGGWTFEVYVNAKLAASQRNLAIYPDIGAPRITIGANDIQNTSVFGSLTEVRYWNTARTSVELRRTMATTLTGYEPGLLGYWPLTEVPSQGAVFENLAAATGTALNGVLTEDPNQTVNSTTDGAFLSVLAGVGGAPAVQAQGFLRANHWNHLAAVYEAAGALSLNPSLDRARLDYGVCKDASGLTIQGQASLEAWVQMQTSGNTPQTIMSQWGTVPAQQAFQFGVAPNGTPFCTVGVVDPTSQSPVQLTATSTVDAIDGKPHHLVATWSTAILQGDAPGTSCTLTLYVDGIAQTPVSKVYPTAALQVIDSSAPFSLGISALQTASSGAVAVESQGPFQGVLTGARFWSIALSATQVQAAMALRQLFTAKGLISAWWFEEGTGLIASDTAGDNDLTLSDIDLWAAFGAISQLAVYGNGVYIGRIRPPAPADAAPYLGATQFTLGAYMHGGAPQLGFKGAVAEVRLWGSAHSQAQLRETMYRTLLGNEEGLRAYWRLDGNAIDQTGRGNDGTPVGSPWYVASAAPVANEGPEVRNVYKGPATDFQEPLVGTATVVEFGQAESLSDDTPFGVLRRGYFYTNPSLTLDTRYGIGELDLVYIGQVQTNPQLIGFIEGAPPVPSENLSRPLYSSILGFNSYQDATSVSLTQTETNAFSFSSQDYKTSITMDLDLKLGIFYQWKLNIQNPVTAMQAFTNKWKLGVHSKHNLVRAHQTDEKYTSSWTRTATDTLGLRGQWEPAQDHAQDYVNPQVGRRYQPTNIGYALVESLAADLFSMQLRATGAMVGRIVVPDPRAAPERNIIIFQIEPSYVKNGTLDGKIGLENDPIYPNADTVRGSYFKPAEARLLRAAVERDEKALQTYFGQFNAESRGQDGLADLSDPAAQQFYDFSGHTGRMGIANSYVWSAYGGLHKEEEQFASVHERTYTGFYSYSGSGGPMGEFEVAPIIGVFGGIDLLLGGQLKVTVAKTETQTELLGLAVSAPGEPVLQSYDPVSNTYSPGPCPGKVSSYRFMTFYLPSSQDNFDAFWSTVVNQKWLNFSSDPDAAALRSARLRANHAWRVLHRVTYVSRVPPTIDTNPAQTAVKDVRIAIAVEDNTLLIQLVQQALGTPSPTPAQIGAALGTVLAPADGSPSVLGKLVPWWQTFVNSTRPTAADGLGTDPNPAAVALLHRILLNASTYLQAGYATGVLPLPSDTST